MLLISWETDQEILKGPGITPHTCDLKLLVVRDGDPEPQHLLKGRVNNYFILFYIRYYHVCPNSMSSEKLKGFAYLGWFPLQERALESYGACAVFTEFTNVHSRGDKEAVPQGGSQSAASHHVPRETDPAPQSASVSSYQNCVSVSFRI